ncbi:MAG: efflux transporter, outer membrane factor (OMF) lipoprotein, NodT family [Candidatus Kentron sp. G]|nr:MAG: efflux transporter, outer membrane factor (OMF) lipoprotein, NodT family [Candidatus Kentron sp. G]VFN00535.1 MAG: efflux transporter, outer membrane factor (OMF) lipoprotein, NodT family [Candidatus Kentron sp. G]VFN02567.1 MAG: efflux transporter, outer membrane factor (OMF) lipoprotein, NodT family [Candidatus Kentron sp. G]
MTIIFAAHSPARRGCIILLCCLGISVGCTRSAPGPQEPKYLQLTVTLPENWTASANAHGKMTRGPIAAAPITGAETGTATDALPDGSETSWLTGFDDPVLPSLVAEALGKNFDLEAAAARVEAARASAKQEGAERLPDITAGFSASRTKQNTAGRSKSSSFGGIFNRFDLNANIGWELDLWNRIDNTAKAAEAEAEASQADYRAARLALAANVAYAWFDTIEADRQLRLADKTVASFENTLKAIEQRYRLGIGAALDVRLARENLASARGQRHSRVRGRDVAIRSLEILLGRYPAGALNIQQGLPELGQAVPAGLPADLLNRRPDIAGANARLLATEHHLGAARANRLPTIGLTATGGTASDTLRNLLDWQSLVWSLVGDLSQPIWRGGRLSAEVALAEANRQEAWAEYTSVVLQALREVESALTAQVLLAEQQAALRAAEEEATAAVVLAQDQYRQGLSDIVTLLSTQRREFDAKSSLLDITKQRLHARIDLHLALGGGF